MTCQYCDEEIVVSEVKGFHDECLYRAIVGSAAHQLQQCSCYGGQGEDPPEMTRRQAAKLAYDAYFKRKRQAVN